MQKEDPSPTSRSAQLQELEWRLLQMEALVKELRQEVAELKSSVRDEDLRNIQKMRAYQQKVDSLGKFAESA
jgi:predicted RNase H-like nuclease (RuvC/YqgF family)